MLEITAPDPDGVALAGALGLIVTQTLALIGVLMRKAAEDETERRLKAETSIKALELLSVDELTPGSWAQAGAAALLLDQLGYFDSAMSLVEVLWPQEAITTSSAMIVIDGGLRSENPIDQTNAMVVLSRNASRTVGDDDRNKPSRFSDRAWLSSAGDSLVDELFGYIFELLSLATVKRDPSLPLPSLDNLVFRLNHPMPELLAFGELDQGYELDDALFSSVDDSYRDSAIVLVDAVLPVFVNFGLALDSHQGLLESTDVLADVVTRLPAIEGKKSADAEARRIREWIESYVLTMSRGQTGLD